MKRGGIKRLPISRPEGQTNLFEEAKKVDQLSTLKGAQEKLFSELGLHHELELDEHTLTIIRDRAKDEKGKKSFEEKAAEFYSDYFLVLNGSFWGDRSEEIEGKFLSALKEE
jgi:hypothetical protein